MSGTNLLLLAIVFLSIIAGQIGWDQENVTLVLAVVFAGVIVASVALRKTTEPRPDRSKPTPLEMEFTMRRATPRERRC
jgi:hypothetical protein